MWQAKRGTQDAVGWTRIVIDKGLHDPQAGLNLNNNCLIKKIKR